MQFRCTLFSGHEPTSSDLSVIGVYHGSSELFHLSFQAWYPGPQDPGLPSDLQGLVRPKGSIDFETLSSTDLSGNLLFSGMSLCLDHP